MLNSVVGLYIGHNIISVVQLKKTLTGYKIITCGRTEIYSQGFTDLNNNAEILSSDKKFKTVEAIKKLFKELKIKNNNVVTALSGRDVIVRYFQMPWIPKNEWSLAVNFEAKKHIPFKMDEMAGDYQVNIEKQGTSRIMHVVYAAVKLKYMNEHINLIKEAGLNVQRVEAMPFSLIRFFELGGDIKKDITTAVIEINSDEASVSIVRNNVQYLTRDISLSIVQNEAKVKTQIINEIKISFDYYHRQFPGGKVEKIILCGDYNIDDLRKVFSEYFSCPVEIGKGTKIIKSKAGVPVYLTGAAALAVKETRKNVIQINFLKKENKNKKIIILQKIAVIEIGVVMAVMLILNFGMQQYLVSLKRNYQNIKLQNLKLEENIIDADAKDDDLEKIKTMVSKKTKVFQRLITNRIYVVNILNSIIKLMPDDMWFSEISFKQGVDKKFSDINRNLVLKGSVFRGNIEKEVDSINNFIDRLKADKNFKITFNNVRLGSIKKQIKSDVSVTSFDAVFSFGEKTRRR